jgi:hypothetical protein
MKQGPDSQFFEKRISIFSSAEGLRNYKEKLGKWDLFVSVKRFST